MKIKICGIKDVATAEFCKGTDVDFVGLVFTKSSRKISVQTAAKIVDSLGSPLKNFKFNDTLPKHPIMNTNEWFVESHKVLDFYLNIKKPLTVGVFANESIEEINNIVEVTGIDLVQLAGEYDIEDSQAINCQTLYSLGINDYSSPELLKDQIRSGFALSLIFDSLSSDSLGGTGKVFNWDILQDISIQIPFLLAGGLNIDNVELAMKICRPWGLDVSSGVESNGVKDLNLIEEFVNRVRGFNG
ncbi:MAG: hypothetical protein CL779_01610 [Chloroflexi bacterium]|nr:hypothetical protein [Chloroflexota bacterium]|tara:strand:- start:10565 stop:11296 length:732 start_codon:yes stop_codon:yes gene_type:complete